MTHFLTEANKEDDNLDTWTTDILFNAFKCLKIYKIIYNDLRVYDFSKFRFDKLILSEIRFVAQSEFLGPDFLFLIWFNTIRSHSSCLCSISLLIN